MKLIFLCDLFQRKVEQYVPEGIGKSEKHGDITIQLIKEEIRSDFTTRVLDVSQVTIYILILPGLLQVMYITELLQVPYVKG